MTNERACANGTAMSRRTLLTALPATGVALALPSTGTANVTDPLVHLYQEWLNARREWEALAHLPGNKNLDDPRSLDAEAREYAAEAQMLMIKPTSLEGIAALAAVAWFHVNPGYLDPNEFELEDQSQDCKAIVAIWQACTGWEGLPAI